MSKSTCDILLGMCLIAMSITGLYVFSLEYRIQAVKYEMESECIAEYIRSNYRRADIVTGDGKCWIRGEGEPYYVN